MNLWDDVLNKVEAKVNRHSFATWFRPTTFVTLQDSSLVVRVPNAQFKDWLTKNYFSIIQEALAELGQAQLNLVFESDPETSPAPETSLAPDRDPLPTASLNPKYTFETFVVGASNQFAHAAARAVAEIPSKSYNPLFIYGGVGLGKTHLMHAIAHKVLEERPETRIVYVSAEHFTNAFIEALQHHKMDQFRARYRAQCDLLLVDDIQFLAGREQTQEEFFHTLSLIHI